MPKRRIEKELLGLERQYWQALKDRDVESTLRLTADPCIVAGASGVNRIDKQSMSKMLEDNTSYELNDFVVDDDVQVQMLGYDVAILAYKVREDLTVDGKHVELEAADASTWVRRDGQWVCALHTESILGDPFGRDKKKTRSAKPKS